MRRRCVCRGRAAVSTAVETFNYILEADWDGHSGPILVSLAVWIVLPMTLGILRTSRK